jgi:hypothetical protein
MKARIGVAATIALAGVVSVGCTSGSRALVDQQLADGLLGPEPVNASQTTDLTDALHDAGVNVADAPRDAVALAGATFCGTTALEPGEFQGDPESPAETAARACLLDAQTALRPAVLVDVSTTTEGDPIVTVWRTLTDGTAASFVDTTRDDFGPKQWILQPCPDPATPITGEVAPRLTDLGAWIVCR